MALLFFVDHLMLKGGQRTVHDLSCQFGARGFTEEMRQAVGTTQEGLTDFLAQFPSLFVVEGDQVMLKGFGEVEASNHLMHIPATDRDYAGEAIKFFVQKLEKFGPELQIKSLLGHRSQAAPEVRLVSGRHLKEFADFLASQTDYFVVEGDRVRLKNMPEPKAQPEQFVDEEGRPLAGHRAKLAAVEFMKSVLEQNEDQPIPLDQFYRKFCDHFPHHIRQEVATNPKELLMFLKLNRHIFFIRSNKVQLVRLRPGGEEMGSESGRSTEEATGSERSAGSPPEDAAGNANGDHSAAATAAMFPLNRENLHRVLLVKTVRQAQEAVNALKADLQKADAASAAAGKFLAIDFKLVSLGSHHPLEQFVALIVVCVPVGQQLMVAFDLAHSEAILTESGLVQMLEDDSLLKVIHDVRRVAPLLAHRYDLHLHNVFDTQIAHSVIQHHKFGKPMGELRAISFVNLQRVHFPQSLVLSDVSPRKLSQTPNWADRPVPPDLLLSACEECHCLANGLFRLLHNQMPQQFRPLFDKLSAEALAPQEQQQNHQQMVRNGSGHNLMIAASRNGSGTPERRVQPLMDLALNGIYRPPGSRRASCQPVNGFAFSPAAAGFMSPSPLRKISAPPAQQSPLLGSQRRLSTRPAAGTAAAAAVEMCNAETQTISTGEVVVLKVYYDEEEKTPTPPEHTNGNGNGNGRVRKQLQQQPKAESVEESADETMEMPTRTGTTGTAAAISHGQIAQ